MAKRSFISHFFKPSQDNDVNSIEEQLMLDEMRQAEADMAAAKSKASESETQLENLLQEVEASKSHTLAEETKALEASVEALSVNQLLRDLKRAKSEEEIAELLEQYQKQHQQHAEKISQITNEKHLREHLAMSVALKSLQQNMQAMRGEQLVKAVQENVKAQQQQIKEQAQKLQQQHTRQQAEKAAKQPSELQAAQLRANQQQLNTRQDVARQAANLAFKSSHSQQATPSQTNTLQQQLAARLAAARNAKHPDTTQRSSGSAAQHRSGQQHSEQSRQALRQTVQTPYALQPQTASGKQAPQPDGQQQHTAPMATRQTPQSAQATTHQHSITIQPSALHQRIGAAIESLATAHDKAASLQHLQSYLQESTLSNDIEESMKRPCKCSMESAQKNSAVIMGF